MKAEASLLAHARSDTTGSVLVHRLTCKTWVACAELEHFRQVAMSAADGPKKAIWQQHKQAADLAFKHNKYPEAAASYTKVIIALNDDREQRPAVADRAKVYANRSLACYKMADFKEALKDAQVAGTIQ